MRLHQVERENEQENYRAINLMTKSKYGAMNKMTTYLNNLFLYSSICKARERGVYVYIYIYMEQKSANLLESTSSLNFQKLQTKKTAASTETMD